jgi:probable rRNA maturation factor
LIEIRFGNGVRGVAKSWVAGVVKKTLLFEKTPGKAVGVLLTDNKEIRRINKKFLKHDYATDVISFPLKDGSADALVAGGAEEPGYLGDLVVSVEMARSLAKELKIGFKEELARYLVHGTLHLLGHDDKKKVDRKRMHKRQEEILMSLRGVTK